MARAIVAILLAGGLAAAGGAAIAETAGSPTDVAPVTVQAPRRPPVEMLPDYDTCLQAAADPYTAALIGAGAMPRLYVKTRPPRNPDWNAPPRTSPGSPLPEVLSLKDYQRAAQRLRHADDAAEAYRDAVDLGSLFQGVDTGRLRAIARCLDDSLDMDTFMDAFAEDMSVTNPDMMGVRGRVEILLRDKTLPLAFALFEDGRYEEALEQFKAHDRKIYNPEAMLAIGKIYLYALKDKSDPVEAVKWLKMAAGSKFDPWSQTPMFDPREPDRNTALGEAAMILADLYATGHGPIPKDPAQSRKFLDRAWDVGHIPAATRLGDIYYRGIDTPKDLKKAFRYYRDAAKFAHVPAMNALARMYETGEAEGGADPVKAAAWRNEAARFDDPEGLYALAVAYDRGEGVAADPDRALALYKLAAVNGAPKAQTALGGFFQKGERGLDRDLKIARGWYEHAAIAGDAEGMVRLAEMMARGDGGDTDRVKAWGWLKRAQDLGHPQAAAVAAALEARFTAADRAGVEALEQARTAPAPPASGP
jgi:TPR repeat protein